MELLKLEGEEMTSEDKEFDCPICTYDNNYGNVKCAICGHIFEKNCEEIGKYLFKVNLKFNLLKYFRPISGENK